MTVIVNTVMMGGDAEDDGDAFDFSPLETPESTLNTI